MGPMDIGVPDRCWVRGQTIGDNDGARLNALKQERAQCWCLSVGDNAQSASPKPSRAESLNGHRHERLPCGTPSSLAGFDATDEHLVDLDLSGKRFAGWTYHGRPQAMQHGPGRLVRTEAQEPMQRLGRYAVLCRGHIPGSSEPNREGRACAMEDCPGGDRHPASTGCAPKPAIAHPPTARGFAARADEAVGPAKPLEVVETCRIVREPRQQIRIAARVIAPRPKTGSRFLCWGRHPLYIVLTALRWIPLLS